MKNGVSKLINNKSLKNISLPLLGATVGGVLSKQPGLTNAALNIAKRHPFARTVATAGLVIGAGTMVGKKISDHNKGLATQQFMQERAKTHEEVVKSNDVAVKQDKENERIAQEEANKEAANKGAAK